jgi:predicted dehydrogenase
MMKAVVIGYGSIGRRHARLLKSLQFDVALVTSQNIDEYRSFTSISAAIEQWQPQYTVIASPTSQHFQDLTEIARMNYTGICLVEKPLFHSNQPAPEIPQGLLAVGYNLRFLPAIQRLRHITEGEAILSANFYNGEYLPDWRPNRDYRTTTSAKRSLGGGVLRDLSHEIDFIHYLLGAPTSTVGNVSQLGELDIDTEDTVQAIFRHESACATTLTLSYLDRTRRREILLTTNDKSVHCNLLSGEISINGIAERFATERDQTFVAMHKDVISNQFAVAATLSQGMDVLRTLEMIEESNLRQQWVVR